MVENLEQMDLFGGGSGLIPPPMVVEPSTGMVRVAPGRHAWVPKDAATPPESYVMCRWSRQSDGTYAPVPVAGRYVRLDSRTATLLGFPARKPAEAGRSDMGKGANREARRSDMGERANREAGRSDMGKGANREAGRSDMGKGANREAGRPDMERCRYDTIIRLGRAGFVDVVRIAPNTILLDLDSWYRHLADCIDDPDRWDEGSEDRETYLKANGLGGWKRYM